MDTKICPDCTNELSLEFFNKDKSRSDGYYPYCKDCTKVRKLKLDGIIVTEKILNGKKLEFKNCFTCHEVKSFEEFDNFKNGYKNKSRDCSSCRDIKKRKRKEEKSLKDKEYRIKNKSRLSNYKQEYYEKNKDKLLDYKKEWYEKNKDKHLLKCKQWVEDNKEKVKTYQSEYRVRYFSDKENKLKRINYERTYKKRPEVKTRISAYKRSERGREVNNRAYHKRRSLERKLIATLTKEQWSDAINHFSNICAYCGESTELITKDHFVPISKQGEFTVKNIIPACEFCNYSKNDRDFFDWYPKQPFYSKQRERKILKYLDIKDNEQQIALF
jgi:hypothetical protein